MNLANMAAYQAFIMRGIPYVYGGQNNAGLDCSGFIVQLLRRAGYNIEDLTADQLLTTIFTQKVVGDVRGTIECAFLIDGSGHASHVELILDHNSRITIGASEDMGEVSVRTWPYALNDTQVRYADMSYLIARLVRGDPTQDVR
jgi:hypothetical protein